MKLIFKILIMSGVLVIVSAQVFFSICSEQFKRSDN